jgi:transcription antitermination factor NusG
MAVEKKLEYKWYVVRAISGQEKKVKTYIENELL